MLLIANNLLERTDLEPWLTSLLIEPTARGQGVGQLLIGHCLRYVAAAGYSKLYLHTTEAPDYYRRLGWAEIDQAGKKIVFTMQC